MGTQNGVSVQDWGKLHIGYLSERIWKHSLLLALMNTPKEIKETFQLKRLTSRCRDSVMDLLLYSRIKNSDE